MEEYHVVDVNDMIAATYVFANLVLTPRANPNLTPTLDG
jgi:hypothetical protein